MFYTFLIGFLGYKRIHNLVRVILIQKGWKRIVFNIAYLNQMYICIYSYDLTFENIFLLRLVAFIIAVVVLLG